METEERFKPFHETFNKIAFGMALAHIYPNEKEGQWKKRAMLHFISVLFMGAQVFWFMVYTVECIKNSDLFNLLRNVPIWIIAYLFVFKTSYAIMNTKTFAAVLNIISKDYLDANDMEEDYKEIYRVYLKQSKHEELVWTILPILLSLQYPLTAVFLNIYEAMQNDLGRRYMVHDMSMIYVEHIQYKTPFFEIYFIYVTIICLLFTPIFTGFGGSFSIATNHFCLKLKLMAHKVDRAFKESNDTQELHKKLSEAIRDHQEALQFFDAMQTFYGWWLLNIFLVNSILISFNLYLMHMLGRLDLKYCIFIVSFGVQTYLPCASASVVKEAAEKSVWDLYLVPWETQNDPSIIKVLIFMIARAQQPLVFSGKGVVDFNMQLFISMMQSAYSFYTLITS